MDRPLIQMGAPALRAIERFRLSTLRPLRGDVFALDTETTGFNPYNGARVFCYTIFSNVGEDLFLPKTPETTEYVIDLLQDPKRTAVFQNGKYDLKMLTFEGFDLDDLRAKYEDTLAMGVLMDEYGAHDLGYMVKRWLGLNSSIKSTPGEWLAIANKKVNLEHRRSKCTGSIPAKDDPRTGHPCPKCGMRLLNYSDVPDEIIVPYARWDSQHTLKLYYYLKTPIAQYCPELYRTEVDLIQCTIGMERRGVLLDMDRVRDLRKQAQSDLAYIEEYMQKVVGRDFIIKGSGSKNDLLKVITEDLGWEIKNRTAKGNPQFDEYGMLQYLDSRLAHIVREYAETTPIREYMAKFVEEGKRIGADAGQAFVPLMLKWRELSKMVTTYYRPFKHMAIPVRKSDRNVAVLHGRFNSLTAITGRFSSSEPNLQNIPRILGPRQCFAVRRGYVNYHFDYSQVEMRLFIHYAKDEKLKAALEAGKDLHLQTATEIFDKPEHEITKEERKKAKSTNFGILYGSGAETLGETLTKMGIPTTKAMATTYLMRYHKAKPSVRRIMSKMKAELMRRGFVQNEFGRRFRVPLKLSYKALNAIIQGCSADIMKRAMVRIWKFLRKNDCRSRIIMTIHDEIVVEIHRDEEPWLVPIIKRLMEKDSHLFWVPITAEVERTFTYWSDKNDKSLTCNSKLCGECSGSWGAGPSWSYPCGCKCHEEKNHERLQRAQGTAGRGKPASV